MGTVNPTVPSRTRPTRALWALTRSRTRCATTRRLLLCATRPPSPLWCSRCLVLLFSTVWSPLTTTCSATPLRPLCRRARPPRPRWPMCNCRQTLRAWHCGERPHDGRCLRRCQPGRFVRPVPRDPLLQHSLLGERRRDGLTAEFKCADGSDPSTCGYQSVQSSFRLDNLILTYDACPRVVQYGLDSAVSFLRLHEDVPRAVPVSAPAQQGSTLYGRCSVEPSAGATFQSVTLSALNVIQQSAGGPIDLGDKLGESYLLMLSALSQNSPTNPVWDFNLEMDPSVFLLANTYYLEATLDLTFANTGPLTRKLRMPLLARASGAKLRSTLSNPHAVALVALSGRADNDSETPEGIFSNTFEMRAADAEAEATDGASSSAESGNNTAMIAGIAGGVAGLVVVSAFILAAVVFKKRRDSRERSASDAPLRSVGVSNDLDL